MQNNSEKNTFGDGNDNLANAAKQTSKAVKQAGKTAAKATEQATKTAASAVVKAGVETGKAVASVAAGTAAGGPVGAIISAVWSMRHTIIKILVCIALVVVFIVVAIISLPSMLFNSIFGKDESGTFNDAYNKATTAIVDVIQIGYQCSLGFIDNLISDGGYDYSLSMDALSDNANPMQGYDSCYIMAAYSVSMQQGDASQDDMLSKLGGVADLMFPVTYTVREVESFFKDPLGYIQSIFVTVVECVIHPFDGTVLLKAFGLDLDAQYGDFGITYGEAIDDMSQAIKLSLGD